MSVKQNKDHVIEKCLKCGVMNRIPAHPPHKRAICGICKSDLPDPYRIQVNHLNFELLPHGKWDISEVIAYYRVESKHFKNELQGLSFQEDRLTAINGLRPSECYVGKESWLGYIAFRFSGTTKTVLECPFEGNATYILTGDWKKLVRYSKKEIRDYYPHRYIKIVHKNDWVSRIERALRI